jgi:hypothetical protein
MADYSQRLANMRSRRLGLDTGTLLTKSESLASLSSLTEAYEKRAKTGAIKYALGAMQELDPKYTQVSFQEGDRVKNQLNLGLQNANIPATFEYQGSVPLNIHIRFASDIDLLVLHAGFVTADSTGSRASTYINLPGSVLADMLVLRAQCESILDAKFPQAKVDKSGSKSIAISGGSLQRKVDIVPSHWHDSAEYQASGQKHDRVVKILDKANLVMLPNRPFLHMKRIDERDARSNGGAKKLIRLLKNIRKDSSRSIGLTSYDIAALVWHFDDQAINKPYYLELSLVAEAQRYLQAMVANPEFTKTLNVPDLSRKIIDSPEKFTALTILKSEVDDLATSIARELKPLYISDQDLIRKSLMEAQVF